MKKVGCFAAIVAILLVTTPLSAHHSIHAQYLENASLVRIEGTVEGFFFRNPHTYIRVVDDKMENDLGLPVSYDVEWAVANALMRQGITRDSFKPGDHVIITGNPSRTASEHRLYLRSIDRPSDGFHSEQPFKEWGSDIGDGKLALPR